LSIDRTIKELGIYQNLLADLERRRKGLIKMIRVVIPTYPKSPGNRNVRYSHSVLVLLIAK